MFSPDILEEEARKHLVDRETENTLRALVNALRVPIAGRSTRHTITNWGTEHLYPYIGELIHYDAVNRRGRPHIEQYRYRGAGGLAHKILRTDGDIQRLNATRSALSDMMGESHTALGKLFETLLKLDGDRDTEAHSDERERDSAIVLNTPWVELLRSGVHNIVVRDSYVPAKRFEALMHWVPYCIALHQLDIAADVLGKEGPAIPVDFRDTTNPIRQWSQSVLDISKTYIYRALEEKARENPETVELLYQPTQNWRKTCRGFFNSTLAEVGALNAPVGKQHFSLKLALLEAMVPAMLAPEEKVPFEYFCRNILFERMRLVIDEKSAEQTPMGDKIDLTDFQENKEAFADQLKALGMLVEYSDATRMVGGEIS
ncbi:MAG: hypothetical protein HOC20_06515 [Chloroflexi bacterium]|nr:hypothetical protein [Chloroflexota bacterium]